jgi:hypothetical protein
MKQVYFIEIIQCNKCRGRPCVCPDSGNPDNGKGNKNNDKTNKRVNTRFTPTGGKFIYSKNSIS